MFSRRYFMLRSFEKYFSVLHIPVFLCSFLGSTASIASPESRAYKLHLRIAGVPPTEAVQNAMVQQIESGNPVVAAMMATDHAHFYDGTLKNWVAPWTNRARSVFVDFNDYTATVIGIIRDEKDFRSVLTDDIVYVGDPAQIPASVPNYDGLTNDHYTALQSSAVSLKDSLMEVSQSSVLAFITPDSSAGIMTTRAAAEAYFVAGTNRAMYRFTQLNYLCRDLESMHDATQPLDRIRQDVDRNPAEKPESFINECAGCHSGMDALAGAFAYYDFTVPPGTPEEANNPPSTIVYTHEKISPKYTNNFTVFPEGFPTVDDSWVNYWREGRNSRIGWNKSLPAKGHGAKSLGRELANSHAFAQCQVEKAFELVCLTKPQTQGDKATVLSITNRFVESGYNMKVPIAESAAYCVDE